MVRNRECRRGPALNGVAAFASAPVRACEELSAVRIGLVTIGAGCVRDERFEIAAVVTLEAGNLDVFAEQGKLCFCVIEC